MDEVRAAAPKKHRVAVITGASSGMGRATCFQFAQNGFIVYAVSRREKLLVELADEFTMANPIALGRIIPVKADVTSATEVHELLLRLEDDGGSVDVLFNNAGMGRTIPFESTSIELWNETIAVNLTAVFLVTQTLLPLLRRSERGGIIITNASIAAKRAFMGFSAYAAAKSGIIGLSRVLREELRADKIRVMTLIPGAVDSEFWNPLAGEWDRKRMMNSSTIAEIVYSMANLPREATVEEIVIMPSGGVL